jgi:hypothetical protein
MAKLKLRRMSVKRRPALLSSSRASHVWIRGCSSMKSGWWVRRPWSRCNPKSGGGTRRETRQGPTAVGDSVYYRPSRNVRKPLPSPSGLRFRRTGSGSRAIVPCASPMSANTTRSGTRSSSSSMTICSGGPRFSLECSRPPQSSPSRSNRPSACRSACSSTSAERRTG